MTGRAGGGVPHRTGKSTGADHDRVHRQDELCSSSAERVILATSSASFPGLPRGLCARLMRRACATFNALISYAQRKKCMPPLCGLAQKNESFHKQLSHRRGSLRSCRINSRLYSRRTGVRFPKKKGDVTLVCVIFGDLFASLGVFGLAQ